MFKFQCSGFKVQNNICDLLVAIPGHRSIDKYGIMDRPGILKLRQVEFGAP